ncbi:MAG: hypothetical protein GY859_41015, partial [Desulfobacterales bacterium]|nr:hypothetical protein [Desulfobacterales bacterium]
LLKGCGETVLDRLQPADAVAFFQAQGVRGSRAEIEQACDPYGYHPLSLRLLAGLIASDPKNAGDITAVRRLDITGDLIQRRHHVLRRAHDNLGPGPRSLLGRVACFRGPVGYDALKSLAEKGKTDLDLELRDLLGRGLLNRDEKNSRFDLHPIVRRYAYDRLTGEDRADAHQQLRDYFAAVETPDKVEKIEDLNPVIELYHHTVRAGRFDKACDLFHDRLAKPLYFQFGAYSLQIELLRALFPDGEDRPPRLKDESAQGWTLNELANSYSLNGQPRRAVPLYEQSVSICEKLNSKKNLAIGLGNLANMALIHIGALQSAEENQRRRIKLCREIKDEHSEAIGRRDLRRLLL